MVPLLPPPKIGSMINLYVASLVLLIGYVTRIMFILAKVSGL